MATYLEQSDRIKLSNLDVRILIALLGGPDEGAALMRKCRKDTMEDAPNDGVFYSALKSLVQLMLVQVHRPAPRLIPGDRRPLGNIRRAYEITGIGLMLLDAETAQMQRLLNLTADRRGVTVVRLERAKRRQEAQATTPSGKRW